MGPNTSHVFDIYQRRKLVIKPLPNFNIHQSIFADILHPKCNLNYCTCMLYNCNSLSFSSDIYLNYFGTNWFLKIFYPKHKHAQGYRLGKGNLEFTISPRIYTLYTMVFFYTIFFTRIREITRVFQLSRAKCAEGNSYQELPRVKALRSISIINGLLLHY